MDKIIHVFEKAGLGIAPFYIKGIYDLGEYNPLKPIRKSCDYCSQGGLRYICIIIDSQGKQFKVGDECVYKTGDRGLINLTKKHINKLKKEARIKSENKLIEKYIDKIKDKNIINELNKIPHPNEYLFNQGKTFYDYLIFCGIFAKYPNRNMQLKACRKIKKLLKTEQPN